MSSPSLRISALSLLTLAFAWAILSAARAESPIMPAYTITPITMEADMEFNLSLLSYDFNCGTTFDNLATSVVGNVITLSFLDHPNPTAVCPAIYRPYGPTFKMAALKPGTYTVKAYRHPDCLPCKRLGVTADAGTLTITAGVATKDWFLKTEEVQAGKPFTLQLLNQAYGNCQTSFSNKSIITSDNRIMATFLVENHPERVCIMDISPHGPAFEMQGLKVGVYPVYVASLLACEVTAPFCAVLRETPSPSDTLVVTQSLAILLSDLHAGTSKVQMNGTRANFILPEGIGGNWKAELLSLNGQRLASASVNAEGGSHAEFEMGIRPDRGVYLMRLSAPDGETYMLPFVRKD
ncbi:MAG: hypothetical protein M3Y08_03815 [Fibrobacterota bacterium]|nr:hypothetical protein [Fibrobacterota bacterium]